MYKKQASLYTVLLAYLQEITNVDDECSMRQVGPVWMEAWSICLAKSVAWKFDGIYLARQVTR